MSFINFY